MHLPGTESTAVRKKARTSFGPATSKVSERFVLGSLETETTGKGGRGESVKERGVGPIGKWNIPGRGNGVRDGQRLGSCWSCVSCTWILGFYLLVAQRASSGIPRSSVFSFFSSKRDVWPLNAILWVGQGGHSMHLHTRGTAK